jgi:hypothetical protein
MLMRALQVPACIVFLAGATAASTVPAPTPLVETTPSLCRADEIVVFDCRFEHKQLALCGKGDFNRSGASLLYRFGTPAHVEMEYPAPGKRPEFSQQDDGWAGGIDENGDRSGGSEKLVWFGRGRRDFVLFSREVREPFDGKINQTRRAAGLLIVDRGQVESVQVCTNEARLPDLPATVARFREFPHDVSGYLPPSY